MRSGQPLFTQNNKRCKEDEKLLACVLGREEKGYIIDTRTQNLAQSAKVDFSCFYICQKILSYFIFKIYIFHNLFKLVLLDIDFT